MIIDDDLVDETDDEGQDTGWLDGDTKSFILHHEKPGSFD